MADDVEGESPQTVKIISRDGYEFIVERDAAMVSGTIKNMLSSPGEQPNPWAVERENSLSPRRRACYRTGVATNGRDGVRLGGGAWSQHWGRSLEPHLTLTL